MQLPRGYTMISSTPSLGDSTKNNLYDEIERLSELLEAYDFPVEDEIELQNYRSKLIKELIK